MKIPEILSFSDWVDIEILADREGMAASAYLERERERGRKERARRARFEARHPGYRKEQSARRRAEHPGQNAAACKKWRDANREKHRKAALDYYYRNRGEILARKRAGKGGDAPCGS